MLLNLLSIALADTGQSGCSPEAVLVEDAVHIEDSCVVLPGTYCDDGRCGSWPGVARSARDLSLRCGVGSDVGYVYYSFDPGRYRFHGFYDEDQQSIGSLHSYGPGLYCCEGQEATYSTAGIPMPSCLAPVLYKLEEEQIPGECPALEGGCSVGSTEAGFGLAVAGMLLLWRRRDALD